ncbi:uncharacterized protein LOC110022379 isoform X2 [Phalaenopsis equestris]|uniref:uncharacterized protein LOC110022379 isoform X2 n=1 Tax=Phalaenopsis equestris TaxID=78828 RepID=UPI0009E2D001|nr:uncharacterized protein LOC110022379 isoform X2 [Phalaenopsis equestris]
MGPPEMVPTEETVEALIEGLVSPFLPRASISRVPPTLEQQEKVAKQMYAVVLLYNCYHRKLFPKLEFLDFSSFCKLACISKSSLLNYMNAMYESDMSSGDLDEPLSITEKMIMDACNVCLALDASKRAPDMEGWPISKVAVFLVDPSKEHCLLSLRSSTKATNSLIEKNLETPLENVVCVLDMNNTLRIMTNGSGSLQDKFNELEDTLQAVAFSAVEEQTGISRSSLSMLGCDLSYSLNHMKSCTRLYIMSYAEPMHNQIPIKSVIESLQGPLVKINGGPEVTKVIEYYGLLPYIDILSDWLSRKTSHSASQHILSQKTAAAKKGSEGIVVIDVHEVSRDSGWSHGNTNNNCSSKAKIISKNENHPLMEDLSIRSQNAGSSSTKMAVLSTVKEEGNEGGFVAFTGQIRDSVMSKKRKAKNVLGSSVTPHYNAGDSSTENLMTLKRDQENSTENAISPNTVIKAKYGLNQVGGTMNNMIVALKSDNNNPVALSKKVDMMSVLQTLKKKRNELCHQQRLLEDKIAHCEMSIQTVLSGKDSSEYRVEFMLKTCETLCSNDEKNDTNLSNNSQCQPQTISRKKLCDAVLRLQSPCQELDEIFCKNNWILPKYCVLPSHDGKFQAAVAVRGMDFECDCKGELKSSPDEARESAATHMLSKLRCMAVRPD